MSTTIEKPNPSPQPANGNPGTVPPWLTNPPIIVPPKSTTQDAQ